MAINFSTLTYKQKLRWSELIYLFILFVMIPFFVGLQIFDKFSHVLSLIFLNITGIPMIILFYRIYLEKFVLTGRWILSVLLFPVYIVIYELYNRLMAIIVIQLPFIPLTYRDQLRSGHPEDFTEMHQTVGYTGLLLLTAFAFAMIKMLFEKQNELLELQYEKVKLELENLRAQVQPHFFFNTLNNLYNLSIQGSPKAPQMIASLSSIMRYVIYEGQDKVPLFKEIEFMQNYFELERIRHTGTDLIDFQIQGDTNGVEIEPLLFLPLIENCFKHALQKDILENPVKIILTIDEEELVFQTSNKIINETEEVNLGGGIGLANVRKRLQLLYKDRQQLNITRDASNFIVTVSIQL